MTDTVLTLRSLLCLANFAVKKKLNTVQKREIKKAK